MKYIKYQSVHTFPFWLGAYDIASRLTYDELDELNYLLEELTEEAEFTETEINDFVWFELLDYWEWTDEQQEEFWKRPYRWNSPF